LVMQNPYSLRRKANESLIVSMSESSKLNFSFHVCLRGDSLYFFANNGRSLDYLRKSKIVIARNAFETSGQRELEILRYLKTNMIVLAYSNSSESKI
jgi:hypothetical protein